MSLLFTAGIIGLRVTKHNFIDEQKALSKVRLFVKKVKIMEIITLTLNPAIDVHCKCDDFCAHKESIASIISRDMGGKGINLSRALLSCGKSHKTLVVVGDENGEEFLKLLQKDGLDVACVQTKGRIRENITVHQKDKKETRLSFEGFKVQENLIDAILEKIPNDLTNTVVTFTGSAPNGISKQKIIEFLLKIKERGAKLVLDSRSLSIEEILSVSPWLIKPNEDETETYSGKKLSSIAVAREVALDFHKKGVENVLISLGERGAVFANNNGVICLSAPKVKVVSTIGAGDSMIAGFISSAIDKKENKEQLAYSIACGSSACETEGTKPPQKERIKKLYDMILSEIE